ncbi:MAG: metallophosphoesterase family protein [Candidatus Poribacteria bacterium]
MIVGDLVAIGPDPVGVLQRIEDMPHVTALRGNTDRCTTTLDRPPPTLDQAAADPTLLPVLLSVAHNFAWTQGMVTAGGWFDWLHELPLDLRLELPNGESLLAVHASPGCDEGPGVHPALTKAELGKVANDADADILCVGHTHWPMTVEVDGVRLINLGSVSNQYPPDRRASYIVVEATSSCVTVERRRVAYDHEAVVDELHRVRHPSTDYITQLQRGHNKPPWRRLDAPPWV